MYFTREPIVETIITPKDGYKLVLRNSKISGQEEFFVDAVEVISFGSTCFFRSLEKPKPFLIPISDYEVLEVREPKMVLKGIGVEKGIKIAGGREVLLKSSKGDEKEHEEEPHSLPNSSHSEKRRDRRRQKKRRGNSETDDHRKEERQKQDESFHGEDERNVAEESIREKPISPLIPPPTTLISETLARYKDAHFFGDPSQEKDDRKSLNSKSREKLINSEERKERDEEVTVIYTTEERNMPFVHEEELDQSNSHRDDEEHSS